MSRLLKRSVLTLLGLVVTFCAVAYAITYHPGRVEPVEVSGDGGESYDGARPLKVLSWNIQYLAGKNYVFYYDLPGDAGPDSRPSPEDIAQTLAEVVRVVRAENPDVVLLQEVDRGSRRTDYADQLALLREHLPEYRYSATAFYHKAAFVPHPQILGSVGMSLGVLSKYKISSATRYELPTMPHDPLTRLFYFHRCVLECILPTTTGGKVSVMNTHLDAFAQGSDTMQRQVELIRGLCARLDAEHTSWLIGGDFNLLPPGQRQFVTASRQAGYREETELAALLERWACYPAPADCVGANRAAFYTHFPNDPTIAGPDRTIDYVFHSRFLALEHGHIRHTDTLRISDHLPVIVTAVPAARAP